MLDPYISEIVQATANLLEDSRQELSEEFNGNKGLRLTRVIAKILQSYYVMGLSLLLVLS
jgi:hypothetical protein